MLPLRRQIGPSLVLWAALTAGAGAQPAAPWVDPSPHRVTHATVDTDVRLEVLDWGGTGRPLVLLAGHGNTAHVFDEFAPRLTQDFRVYGITRRGFGASSAPSAGYTADRLGEDIAQVIEALSIARPILVGHSIAGQELSAVASRHPDRMAALVYLDAAYRYAFHRPGVLENLRDLRTRLDALEAELIKPPRPPAELAPAIRTAMGDTLTEFQKDLQDLTSPPPVPTAPPAPRPADLATFAAYRAWSGRVMGYALPEAELRLLRPPTPEGGVGPGRPAVPAGQAMTAAGAQRFTQIEVPTLAIFASPHGLGPWTKDRPADREQIEAFARFDQSMTERQASWVERAIPKARVVRLANASHYLFLSDADEVIRELSAFIATVP